jgi:TolB-like protein
MEIAAKSIAVLPFDNLSDDKSNAYFAEGIQDEILTRLSKIAALKVISRSSTQKYKSSPDNLREVGKQLGVAHLLEGSVQKIANAVHINVQLIRAATDEHVWAESYNRKLDDVFGVEGEVASAIADQLNAKLSGNEQKAVTEKPTQNTAAYDAYLRGLAIEHTQYGYEAYQQAARDYRKRFSLTKFRFRLARLAVLRSFFSSTRLIRTPNTCGSQGRQIAPAGTNRGSRKAYRYRLTRLCRRSYRYAYAMRLPKVLPVAEPGSFNAASVFGSSRGDRQRKSNWIQGTSNCSPASRELQLFAAL